MRATLYSLGALLLCCLVLFIAATHTNVGRDALGRRIESQFASAYHGTLGIGTIKGNLRRQVFISDVRLFDEQGRLWLSVDSVIATPRWTALLSRRFEVGRVRLLHPILTVHKGGHQPLRRRNPAGGANWAFKSASVAIEQGTVHGASPSEPAARAWLRELQATSLSGIEVRATIEWGTDARQLVVESLAAELDGRNLALHDVAFQVAVAPDTIHVRHLNLRLGATHAQMRGAVTGMGQLEELTWHADVDEATVGLSELAPLLPGLPPVGRLRMAGQLHGTRNMVGADSLALDWGGSSLLVAGEVRGLPDSIAFAVDIDPSSVVPDDAANMLSTIAIPAWLAPEDPVEISGSASGTYAAGLLQAQASLGGRLLGGSYHLSGTVRGGLASGWAYKADVEGDSLALPAGGTVLSGHAMLEGSGLSADSLVGTLRCVLGPSQIAGRALDNLRIEAAIDDRRARATMTAAHGSASADLTAFAAWHEPEPQYRLRLRTTNLDLGPLLRVDSIGSSITGTVDLVGEGFRWDALQGTLTASIDSAEFHVGTQRWSMPGHRITLAAHTMDAVAPRLEIGGDLASGTLQSNARVPVLRSLSALYAGAVRNAMERQYDNRYANADRSAEIPRTAWPPEAQIRHQDHARARLRAAGLDRARLSMDLEVRRASWLGMWLHFIPAVPKRVGSGLRRIDEGFPSGPIGSLRLLASADAITVDGTCKDGGGLAFSVSLGGDLQKPLEESLKGTVTVEAPRLAHRNIVLADVRTALRMRDGTLDLRLQAGSGNRFGPMDVDASIEVLSDRYRAKLNAGTVYVGGAQWKLVPGPSADIFLDAVALNSLTAVQEERPPQYVRAGGLIARGAESNVFTHFEGLRLEQLSEFLGMRRAFVGHLDGTLAWSSSSGVTGHATVDTLSLEEYIVGSLELHSHYLPGSPDVEIILGIKPLRVPPAAHVRRNDFTLEGTMRPKSQNDPGQLNLALDVTRLDAFFLEELIGGIESVEGAFIGSGRVTGTLGHPIFEANLDVSALAFSIPEYNLALDGTGAVTVDRRGIHVRRLALTDSTGGSAVLEGTILFNDYRYLSFDVAGTLNELLIMNVPTFTRRLSWYGTVWASGRATLTGPLDNAFLRSSNLQTSPASEIFIPIRERSSTIDPGFIIYRDPSDDRPEPPSIQRRTNILQRRPDTERRFGAGLDVDLNITGPEGSTIKLVIDPLLGDVITGNGSARVQLQLREGEMNTYGSFDVTSGDYLFTAGEVFMRRFLISDGSIRWDGDPLDPVLDIHAQYRTRASRSGLPEDVGGTLQSSLPLIVHLHITGELNAIQVGLSIGLDQRQEAISDTPLLEAYLNQPDRAAQHATSVLLTNSFLLSAEGTRNEVLAGSALNSVSQLATSQLNRYLSQVIPNADFALGVVSDEAAEDLDVSAGIALRLLDERLLIRGHGIYRGQQVNQPGSQGLEGEFVVQIHLSPTVSVDLFYRREGDVLSESLIISETGVGLSYRTQFSSWRALWNSVFKPGSVVADSSDGGGLQRN